MKPLSEQDKALFAYYRDIPSYKENAVSRAYLCHKWNTNDRTVRLIIADIRANCRRLGMTDFVVSDSHGKGYWCTSDKKEIKAFNDQMMSRVKSIAATVKCAKAFLCDTSQTDLFDGLYV